MASWMKILTEDSQISGNSVSKNWGVAKGCVLKIIPEITADVG
jgi:hypothetical protein